MALLTEAVVREVILEDQAQGWIANRVRFMHHGEEYTVATEGEVIICAGSVQSPQLLELSGIGNPDVLKAAGISLKVDNPNVGENLQDHLSQSKSVVFSFCTLLLTSTNSDSYGLRN